MRWLTTSINLKFWMLAQLKFKGSITAAACLFTLANIAKAGPPFVTDDPEPPPPGWMGNQYPVHHPACRERSGNERTSVRPELRFGEHATTVSSACKNRTTGKRKSGGTG